MPPTYQDTKDGVGVLMDGAFVPPVVGNRDWDSFSSSGIDPDDAFTLPIAEARAAAQAIVHLEADRELAKHSPTGASNALSRELRYREAAAIDGVPSPDPDDYPLLKAEIGINGVDVEAVGTNVRAELDALKVLWAAIETVRATKVSEIDAAATQAQIDAILAGIVWPS